MTVFEQKSNICGGDHFVNSLKWCGVDCGVLLTGSIARWGAERMGRREAATSDGMTSGGAMNSGDRSDCLQGGGITAATAGNGEPGREEPHPGAGCSRHRYYSSRSASADGLVVGGQQGPLENVKKHQHKHNLKHRYEVMETLGKGTYGKVKKAVERASQKTVAIKSIRKERITDDLDRVHIQREIEITSSLRHPNIIRFHEVFESRDKIVIVMEYASSGELYDYVHERRRLTETDAREVFRQITSALHYCHKNGVVHRDLKLENILLDEELNVKLADFGLSNHFQKDTLLQTYCGSPLYASPEIVKGLPYQGPEVDCWALGVLLYALVYGSMPFDGACHATLTEQISQGRYRKPNPPSDACALIDWLLTVRTEERATVEDVANHWWVNWGYEESVCDCPASPHQDCPSPLLARYIDWQNRVAATTSMTADLARPSCGGSVPAAHPFYFSFPLKGDRSGGGRARSVVAPSLRKSRKENAIPQNTAVCASTAPVTASAATGSARSSSTERKTPKGILKPQRSFDSAFLKPNTEIPPSPSRKAPHQPYHPHALPDVLATAILPPPSSYSQPSSKMPKKGILKNIYGGESGYASAPERGSFRLTARRGEGSGDPCDQKLKTSPLRADDSPTMCTEAVRRRKGILKRNGKFSRSLDLPDDVQLSSLSAPIVFPETLQRLLQGAPMGSSSGMEGGFSRPPSVVSEDSLLSSDSFDLLDLSVQSQRRIFSRSMGRSACSSEEDLERLGGEADGEELGRARRWDTDGDGAVSLEGSKDMLR